MAGPRPQLRSGDLTLTGMFHTGSARRAVCTRGGYVIHLYALKKSPKAGSSRRFPFLKERIAVQHKHLEDVFGGCRVNNHLDHKRRPQVDKVIISAKKKVGQKRQYNILDENYPKDPKYSTLPHGNCDGKCLVNHLDSGQGWSSTDLGILAFKNF